jgi:putative FmdB family regulatory protein
LPTYQFKCEKCGLRRDLIRGVHARDEIVVCLVCDGQRMERQTAAPSFTVQGFNAANGYAKGTK